MDKASLKKKALAEIERRADEIIEYATAIWKYPELGFKEFKTAELTEQKYEAMAGNTRKRSLSQEAKHISKETAQDPPSE